MIDAFSFKIITQVDKQIKNRKMQKSVFRDCLIGGVAFFLGTVITGAIATSISQAVAQRPQGEILVTQSAIDEKSKFKFESQGCRRTKTTEVSCDILVTNIGNERWDMEFGNYSNFITNAVDSSGTVYAVKIIKLGASIAEGSSGRVGISAAPGVPTKATFIFEIPQEVAQLAALDVGYNYNNYGLVWRRIAITNIGTIASNSASTPNPGNNCNCTCPPSPPR